MCSVQIYVFPEVLLTPRLTCPRPAGLLKSVANRFGLQLDKATSRGHNAMDGPVLPRDALAAVTTLLTGLDALAMDDAQMGG